jgi:hypothetical protein
MRAPGSVETVGIEPATATLAGRARSLLVIPEIPVLAAAERDGAGPEYVRRSSGRTNVLPLLSSQRAADSPEGCRLAGPEGFEPPSTSVLETGALPIELRHIACSCPANKKPPARASVLGAVSACGLPSAT